MYPLCCETVSYYELTSVSALVIGNKTDEYKQN